MGRARVLQEIRQMRFEEIYDRMQKKRLTTEDAAMILGVNERTVRRHIERYERQGAEGLLDKRIDKTAHNAAPVDEVMNLVTLYETHYQNFTAAHFFDKYRESHRGERCYTWVKSHLQDAGFIKKAKKRGVHRRKRPRQPMKGMMIHQDGSSHEWVEDKVWDLIITMDDADSEIYSGFFVEEEGTWSSFCGVKEVIEEHGLFCSMYVDRGSHYFTTLKAGEKVAKDRTTQFGRAMKRLGIELIAAYSPEARGRSERMFGTLQGRLPNELKLAGIKTIEEANHFMKEVFIPGFNKRFRVKAEFEESAFVPWLSTNLNLDDILCLQEKRTVKKDNTISYRNKCLQIPKDKIRYSYAKAQVTVCEYHDGKMAVYYGPRCLGRFEEAGKFINEEKQTVIRGSVANG